MTEILANGLHHGVSLERYLAQDAIGSTELEWFAASPRYYRWMKSQPRTETPAMALGTAVHMAVLEPDRFLKTYAAEPVARAFGGERPRATKAYKEAVAALEDGGLTVLRNAQQVFAMAQAVHDHPKAAALLTKATEREVTVLWDRDGRRCRGRADALSRHGALIDLKTTRNLKGFSPFEVTRRAYYLQMALYRDGLRANGFPVSHVFMVAVESEPPYDVGVFSMDEAALTAGDMEIEHYMHRLAECEADNEWPGRFPEIEVATITDALAATMADIDEGVA